AREPQRRRKQIRANQELMEQKSIRAPLSDIARMNMTEEVKRDEFVPHLPHEIRQTNQQRQPGPAPEPPASQETPRACQQQAAQNPRNEEEDRVLGQQANAHCR